MTREQAINLARTELDRFPKLSDWGIRLTTDISHNFLGICLYKDKCIVLNAHHIDIHPDPEILDTIRHEIAHALCPFQGHNEIWAAKAKEIGCDYINPCSHLNFTPEIIDAIRSGAQVEVSFTEEKVIHTVKTEELVRKPQYKITRLQDRCEHCGKVAVEDRSTLIPSNDEDKPDQKFIFLECGHLIIRNIPKGTPFHKFISNAHEDYVKNCKHEWGNINSKGQLLQNQCKNCKEFMPREFQIEGMKHGEASLAINKGWCCFDDMGLGKTIQVLGIIKHHPELWPVLYVVKSKIKFQWFKQNLRWLGNDHVCQIIQTSNDYIIPGLKGYIIGYDMMVPKQRKLKSGAVAKQGFDINKLIGVVKSMVLDECQQIKNPDATRTQQVRRIAAGIKVFLLSGTPWKNRGSELYSGLNMVDPRRFSSFAGFKRAWIRTYYDGNRDKEGGINDPERFRKFIEDIAIRRERKEVMKELPPVNRTKLYITLDETENKIYEEEVENFVAWYNNLIIGGEEINQINLLARMAKMRHLVGLAKIPATVDYIEDFVEDTDTNIIVFVHHQDVGRILTTQLKEKFPELQILTLTSQDKDQDRLATITKFNSKRSIMVASTLASGEGVDGLQDSCYTLIMHERQFNPANEEQAEARLDRMGQTSTSVDAIYVEATGSIDEDLDNIVEPKRGEYHRTMNKGEMKAWSENTIVKELAELIVKKHKMKKKKVS